MEPLTLHFLGTGGGRFVMTTQRRRTAGIRLEHGNTHVHIDPGPGALVFSNWAGLGPQRLDGLIVTHCHPDHYNDAEVFIEAMNRGTTRNRGVLASTRSVLNGYEGIGPSISSYHQDKVGKIVELSPGVEFKVKGLGFQAVEGRHGDPDAVGLRIEAPGVGVLGYTGDTGYFPELGKLYGGLRLLMVCTIWPRDRPLNMHLCTDDALRLLREAEPGCAILTHLGMRMLNAGPEPEAAYLEEETGIPVVAARDGMRAILSDKVEIRGPKKIDEPRIIEA